MTWKAWSYRCHSEGRKGTTIDARHPSTLRPGTVGERETRFAQRHPSREQHAHWEAVWPTAFGPLNQGMQVWLYERLHQCQEARAAAARDPDVQRLPGGRQGVGSQDAEMGASPGVSGTMATYRCGYWCFIV